MLHSKTRLNPSLTLFRLVLTVSVTVWHWLAFMYWFDYVGDINRGSTFWSIFSASNLRNPVKSRDEQLTLRFLVKAQEWRIWTHNLLLLCCCFLWCCFTAWGLWVSGEQVSEVGSPPLCARVIGTGQYEWFNEMWPSARVCDWTPCLFTVFSMIYSFNHNRLFPDCLSVA